MIEHDGRIEGISGANRVPVASDLSSPLSRYLSDGHRLIEEERAKAEQSNDIASIVGDIFGGYVPLNVRYGIADALWDAGYRRVPKLDPEPFTFQAGRFKDAGVYGGRRFNPRPEYSQDREDYR